MRRVGFLREGAYDCGRKHQAPPLSRFFGYFLIGIRKYRLWQEIKKESQKRFLLSGLYELFPAFGTGDGDLSFSLRNSHLLMASGTIVIAMILILDLLKEEQEFSVFLIALIDISGKAAENSEEHQHIGNQSAGKLRNRAGKQRSQQRKSKTCTENCHIESVCAVAAGHKTLDACAQRIANLSQPVSESVHTLLLWVKSFLILYSKYIEIQP